jgi:ATP-binding cassette subfamily C protein
VIGEPRLAIERGSYAGLSEPRTMWRVVTGFVSVDVAVVDAAGVPSGERAFFFNAVIGDLVPGSTFRSGTSSFTIYVHAATDASLERIDPEALSAEERELIERRFAAAFERLDAPAATSAQSDGRSFADTVERALVAFGSAYVERLNAERGREVERRTQAIASDRNALYREAFEASHILDRYPIPIDPADDDLTAAVRIVVDRLGVPLVRPIKASRDHETAIRAIALASRLVVRRIVLRGRWWLGEHGPIVGFGREDGRPIALVPRRGAGGYEWIDPVDPRDQHHVDDALAEHVADVGYTLSPTLPQRGPGILALLSLGLRDSQRDIVRVLLLGFTSALLASIVPLAIAPLIDDVLPAGLRGILVVSALLLIVAVLAAATIDAVRNMSTIRVKTRFSSQLQQAIMYRLIGLPTSFFRRYSVGDLTSRALSVEEIEEFAGDATLTVLLTGIFGLVSFGVIAYEDGLVAAVCGALALATLVAFAVQAAMLVRARKKALELSGNLSGFVYQTLTGIAKIRAAAARNRIYVRWLHRFLESRRVLAGTQKLQYRFSIFAAVWPSFGTLCVIATIMIGHGGAFEPGKFFTIFAAFAQLLGATLAIGYSFSTAAAAVPIYDRIRPILDAVPERDSSLGDPGVLSGAISIHDASFSYDGATRPALSHVSQEIAPGSFVAIVGGSGSGKSTLLRLLLGFDTPSDGWVAYDGHALDSLDIVAVRRQMGAVLQTAKLLPGSIFENIAGNAILTRDEAWDAARRVGLASDIEKMPMKLDTVIGASGAGLSGGQRQRIIIARAIAFGPKIVFFDEATSALDNATQAIVSRTLGEMNATRIVIAHRLSTVVDADRILVMDAGRIVQEGTYAELLAVPGPFKTLAERQRM